MKIYISADIEGISGVVNRTQTSPSQHNYDRARKLMTGEVNAAVIGAKAAGAKEILVNDSHGPMTNILIEELDEDARLISGNQKLLGMMEGVDESYDGVLLIGYHAKHNTPGVLAHSYHSGVLYEIKVNGRILGEFEFNSLIAGYYNVPVVLVSGDNILAQQVKDFNERIERIIVKNAHSRYTADCLQPKKVHQLLKEQVEKVLKEKKKLIEPCILKGEVELEVTFLNSAMAEICLLVPGVEMVAPNSVKYKAKDILEAYKVRSALTTLAASTL
ncbi:MAG: M55 family metallopeptidase [Thermotaleaceae bacterium]